MQGKWEEIRINTYRHANFEFTLKNKEEKNSDLVQNLLILWIGHELTDEEAIELLEES